MPAPSVVASLHGRPAASGTSHSISFAAGSLTNGLIAIAIDVSYGGTPSNVQWGGAAATLLLTQGNLWYYGKEGATGGTQNVTFDISIDSRPPYSFVSVTDAGAFGTASGTSSTASGNRSTPSITCPSGGLVLGCYREEFTSTNPSVVAGTIAGSPGFALDGNGKAISAAYRTDTGVLTWASDNGAFAWDAIGVPINSATSLAQAAYRFGNDDGSESGNTWMVGQNTAATIPLGGAARVRFMLQATGDPAATTYQLEFRKVGDATWKKVSP